MAGAVGRIPQALVGPLTCEALSPGKTSGGFAEAPRFLVPPL